MKHWTVSLVREGKVSREWHVWAETLTVGSHGAAKVRLPLPAEPWALRITELPEPQVFEVAEFTLRIADTTAERGRLWERAQVRIVTAADRLEQGEIPNGPAVPSTLKTAVTALCLAGLTHFLAESLADKEPDFLEVRSSSVSAPATISIETPTAPFAVRDTSAAPRDLASLGRRVAASKAPSVVMSGILSAPVTHPQMAHQGSGAGAYATTPEALSLAAATASAARRDGYAQEWESLDQPPPEPPH